MRNPASRLEQPYPAKPRTRLEQPTSAKPRAPGWNTVPTPREGWEVLFERNVATQNLAWHNEESAGQPDPALGGGTPSPSH